MRGIKNRNSAKVKKLAIFLALFLVLGIFLNSLVNVYQKKKEAAEALARMEEERMELSDRAAELEETLARLETKEGLDFEIRKRLNVAAAGENVAIIVEESSGAPLPQPEKSVWDKIREFFENLFD